MKGSKPKFSKEHTFAYNFPNVKVAEHFNESFIIIWSYKVFMESETDPIPQKASKNTIFLWCKPLSASSCIIGPIRVSLLPIYLISLMYNSIADY